MTGNAFRGPLVSRQFAQDLPARCRTALAAPAFHGLERRLARWQAEVQRTLGPASGLLAIRDVAARPLARLLGYELRDATAIAGGTRVRVMTLHAESTLAAVLVLAPWEARLDGCARQAIAEAAARQRRWALVFNGQRLRLIDADRPYARPFIEFDLAIAVRDPKALRLLWTLLRAGALAGSRRTAPELPDIIEAAAAHARAVVQALQGGVQQSLADLSQALARAERGRSSPPSAVVSQALTIVFRLLFLLFAEARALVPVWHPVYRESYAVHGLRALADRGAPDGLWEAIGAISRLAHDGCDIADLHVTAFNGRLFAPEHTPLAARARLDNRVVRRVLAALTDASGTAGDPDGRVTYGDLGVEQLGSIYERLLDVAPALEQALGGSRHQRAPHLDLPPAAGTHGCRSRSRPPISGRRKESGTFYTPVPMADDVVRRTLEPLVRGRSADGILHLRVLDPAMGSGAFLVAAARFLADAWLQARERDQDGGPAGSSDSDRAAALRLVAQRCLYGVDANPVATGLARLSLWLGSLAADRPLTFLDHHLRSGDSLIGASLDDLARGWRSGSRRPPSDLPLFGGLEVERLVRDLLPVRARLAAPDDDVAVVREKEALLTASMRDGLLPRWLRLADLWCARWAWPDGEPPPPNAWAAIADYLLHDRRCLPQPLLARWLDTSAAVAARCRFVHWTLHFPEVFFDDSGRVRADAGFDAVIGNPPWDVVRDDVREANLRAETGAATARLSAFVRGAGVYGRSGGGHLNRCQLFVERTLALLRTGGRLGLVLPWGMAADRAAAPVRRRLFEECDTDRLVAFENAEAIFPVHRGLRFVLWTATTGRATADTRCRFGERSLDALDRPAGPAAVSVSPAFLRRVSGESLEVPWLRCEQDAALLGRLSERWPGLSSPAGWHATFGRELNATDDRDWYTSERGGPPVVDGRHLLPFRVTVDATSRHLRRERTAALLERLPGVGRARLAYRDVASATNRVTLIAAILPAGVVSTHTLFCLRSPLPATRQRALCALLNSYVANYLARLRVTTHVSTYVVEGLPMPVPDTAMTLRLAAAAAALARTASPAREAELQADCARVFGLERDELAYVLGTFPLVDAGARAAVLAAFGGR